jgi:hypothetical protein
MREKAKSLKINEHSVKLSQSWRSSTRTVDIFPFIMLKNHLIQNDFFRDE